MLGQNLHSVMWSSPLSLEMVLFGLDLADVTVLRLYQTFSLESSVITACVFLVCVCVCVCD